MELDSRERFFTRRLGGHFTRDQLRDLTNATLGTHATILRCRRCGLLIRDAAPGEEVFRDDHYDVETLGALHETHVLAFRDKARDYRSQLLPDARVLEVGSYVGGFLSIAAEWRWRAIGTDIGRDPVRFCRALGLDARLGHPAECHLEPASFDAAFVWNCFEQIAEPRELLAEIGAFLRAEGLLTIRVPDAAFYIQHRHELAVLAYNALLGWPHRFGYDEATLRRLVEQYGFAFRGAFRRAAIRPLRRALPPWAQQEEAATIGNDNHGWIELVFRKCAA
jgi:SAM-dependent methyltransferase